MTSNSKFSLQFLKVFRSVNLPSFNSLLILIDSEKAAAVDPFTVTLTNSTGEFTSPRYPDKFRAKDRFTYNIRTQPGTFIRLTWKVFEVWDQAPECNERAFVRIWIG